MLVVLMSTVGQLAVLNGSLAAGVSVMVIGCADRRGIVDLRTVAVTVVLLMWRAHR